MPPNVDPAILEALDLEATSFKLVPHGGSGFSSTYKLVAAKDGETLTYFVKTGTGPDAEVMFRGEHASLNALHSTIPNLHLSPRSHAHGAMRSSPNNFFLVTDFIDLRASSSSSSSSPNSQGTRLSLAAKLAQLHTTPAPIPAGHDKPLFGFPVPTCCGATRQDNTWTPSWPQFYADRRLRFILQEAVRQHGSVDEELAEAVERVAGVVTPRLLGRLKGENMVPVLVHGDLWSGNHGRGRIAGDGGGGGGGAVEEVVYDPACVYGHAEYELGIMRMFGGFGSAFWREYESLVPKAEPAEEWDDRVALYELYHHLNHYAMFGGGYKSGAMAIMRRLIAKYG